MPFESEGRVFYALKFKLELLSFLLLLLPTQLVEMAGGFFVAKKF